MARRQTLSPLLEEGCRGALEAVGDAWLNPGELGGDVALLSPEGNHTHAPPQCTRISGCLGTPPPKWHLAGSHSPLHMPVMVASCAQCPGRAGHSPPGLTTNTATLLPLLPTFLEVHLHLKLEPSAKTATSRLDLVRQSPFFHLARIICCSTKLCYGRGRKGALCPFHTRLPFENLHHSLPPRATFLWTFLQTLSFWVMQ